MNVWLIRLSNGSIFTIAAVTADEAERRALDLAPLGSFVVGRDLAETAPARRLQRSA